MKRPALVSILLFCATLAIAQYPSEQLLLGLYEKEAYAEVLLKADSILNADEGAPKARILQIKADAYYFLNDVEQSLSFYLEALEASSQYSELSMHQLMECNSHAGFCYRYLGKYSDALAYYLRAYSLASKQQDSVEIANQASSLGTIYSHLGEYDKSFTYFDKAQAIDFELKDTIALAYDMVNLGVLHSTLGDHEKAIGYLKKGLEVKKTIAGDHTIHIKRLTKLSDAYLRFGELDSAFLYSEIAQREALRLGDSLGLAKTWIVESEIRRGKGDFEASKRIAGKAYQYFSKEANSYQVFSGLVLAEAYVDLGEYLKAEVLLADLFAISQQLNLIESSIAIVSVRSRLNELRHNYRAALKDMKEHQGLKDTLQKRNKQRAILVLDQEYQTAQKQQQIELLKARDELSQLELKKEKKENLALFLALVTMLSVAIYVYMTLRKKNQLQKRLLSSQINELRLQIKAVMDGSSETMKLEIGAINSAIQEPLSDREFEILNLAVSDMSNIEIAEKTFISTNTVKYHLKNIYQKLGVSNRKEALQFAFRATSG